MALADNPDLWIPIVGRVAAAAERAAGRDSRRARARLRRLRLDRLALGRTAFDDGKELARKIAHELLSPSRETARAGVRHREEDVLSRTRLSRKPSRPRRHRSPRPRVARARRRRRDTLARVLARVSRASATMPSRRDAILARAAALSSSDSDADADVSARDGDRARALGRRRPTVPLEERPVRRDAPYLPPGDRSRRGRGGGGGAPANRGDAASTSGAETFSRAERAAKEDARLLTRLPESERPMVTQEFSMRARAKVRARRDNDFSTR